MNRTQVVVLICACSLVSAFSGGITGYYAALSVPVPTPIAVLDIDALAGSIDSTAPDFKLRMQAVSDAAKATTQRLADGGVVVIDRANVIAAPPQSVIRISAPALQQP